MLGNTVYAVVNPKGQVGPCAGIHPRGAVWPQRCRVFVHNLLFTPYFLCSPLVEAQKPSKARKLHHLLHCSAQHEGECSVLRLWPLCRSREAQILINAEDTCGSSQPLSSGAALRASGGAATPYPIPKGRSTLCFAVPLLQEEEVGPSFGFHCLHGGNRHRAADRRALHISTPNTTLLRFLVLEFG